MAEIDMCPDFGDPIFFDTFSAAFGGTIRLDTFEILIIVRLPLGDSNEWTLEGDFESITLASGLDELTSLAGVDAGWLDAFPSQIKGLGGFAIHDVRMTFDPTAASVSRISLEIGSSSPLDIIPQKLAIKDVRIYLSIYNPTDSDQRAVRGTFSGTIHVGGDAGPDIYIAAEVPDLRFYGSLAEGSSLNLTALVEGLLPGDVTLPSDAPDIELHDLNTTVDVSAGSFSIYARCFSDWQVAGVTLAAVQADVSVTGGESAATIIGTFDVGGVGVTLSADHPQDGAGWQFEGSTGDGQAILIGDLIEDLVQTFGLIVLPSAIEDLIVENLHVSFNTVSKDFTFTCRSQFPVGDGEHDRVAITVTIDLAKENGTYRTEFGGHLDVSAEGLSAPLRFDLQFVQDKASDVFVATYQHGEGDGSLNLGHLIGSVSSSDAELVGLLDGVTIDLKAALFAYSKAQPAPVGQPGEGSGPSGAKFLFGLDVGSDINLSNLPLVGQEFSPDQTLGVDDLQALVACQPFTVDEVKALNALIPEGVTPLPDLSTPPDGGQDQDEEQQESKDALGRGLTLTAKLKLGEEEQTLLLPAAGSGGQKEDPDRLQAASPWALAAAEPSDGTAGAVKWFKLQKSFGPVQFQRLGFQYREQAVWFLLDAALSAAGLTLSLDGLGFGSSLSPFTPKFDLHGLGLAYQNGPLEIGGAFLRVTRESDGTRYDEYEGAAVIKAKALTLSAIGSYAYLDGHPSLFVYAVLDYPLGGPAFFFVTGLAAGFGYNRALVTPSIDEVAQFPLIAEVVGGQTDGSSDKLSDAEKLTQELEKLRQYIPPAAGEVFLAAGIRFTSFKLIDSFALLTVSFGRRLEIDLLGLSTMVLPTPEAGKDVPPLAEVQMALKATFIPDEGFLGVQAQLTAASYILSKKCHLTGGFAFYCWFSGQRAGDFVVSLGGYHPHFDVPAHYPQVPRLGFNWQVDDQLNIKGDAYCALTPSALMAGGHLQATWHSGNLKAWFNAGADFLIAWKPYHYEAAVYVNMGVSYTYHLFGTHHITVDVGADLDIWGPPFSGRAHIHLWIVSFDVTFGSGRQAPKPIDWPVFKASFLPADDQICTIAIKDGLVRKMDTENGDLWIVNPKHFVLVTDSVIPSKSAQASKKTEDYNTFGIGPMNLLPDKLTSKHKIAISRDGKDAVEDFEFAPVLKSVPAGMWGGSLKPDLNGEAMIEDVLAGFEIKPAKPPAPGKTHAIPRDNLQYETTPMHKAYQFVAARQFSGDREQGRQKIHDSIVEPKTVKARNQLLGALGFEPEQELADLDESTADAFLMDPQVGELAG
jgi:hypothetical protein